MLVIFQRSGDRTVLDGSDPEPNIFLPEVEAVHVAGKEDLAYLRSTFTGLPDAPARDAVAYYGDHAKFIVANWWASPITEGPDRTQIFDPEHAIKIAADSLAQLRKSDVYRVIETTADEFRHTLVEYITAGRCDLADEAADVMEKIHQ